MKKIIIFISLLIWISLFSCDFTTEKEKKQAHTIDSLRTVISSLENTIDKNEKSAQDKKQHYDSILNENIRLENLLTRHVKYIYTVQDDVVRDRYGNEWELYEFIDEFGEDYIHTDDIEDYIRDSYTEEDIHYIFEK